VTIRILTISGSLRARSINSEVLAALELVAEVEAGFERYEGLASLPHFNPDLDREGAIPPPAVAGLRQAVAGAQAVVICSPEYAHGVPGSLKNALDWLVSGPEIVHKPVGVLNASEHSRHAQAQLIETLRTMSTVIVPEACITLPINGRKLDAAAIAQDPTLGGALRAAVEALARSA
jgi:chromate reductase